ncbi:MAG: hypothetical protein LKI42_02495, partial [Bacteroidales bacterium]|nr:hypothetical protein [Bacteroidales bacterium]
MGKIMILSFVPVLAVVFCVCCERIDNCSPGQADEVHGTSVSLAGIAGMFSEIPIDLIQIAEVHDAVSSSEANGYDEEYMMNDLISSPGRGVGDEASTTKSVSVYPVPIKDLIEKYLADKFGTKSETDGSSLVTEYLDKLRSSGAQIYWPNSERWDGKTIPIITFDPGDGSGTN